MTELPPVAGVYVAGGVTSVASIIGCISGFGSAVRNGILMSSYIHHLQRSEGVSDLHQAVRRGAMERLAPILRTALGHIRNAEFGVRNEERYEACIPDSAFRVGCGRTVDSAGR